jgi:hypothetical protein
MLYDSGRLLAEALARLPPRQRVRRYMDLAATALRHASITRGSEPKAEYLSIAVAWLALALQTERAAGFDAPKAEATDEAG